MEPITSLIDHVQITVPPMLETDAKRFYGEILGLTEIPKPEVLRDRGGAWYQIGAGQLHVGIEETADGTRSRRHICLRVADLDEAQKLLSARGLEILPEKIQPDGLRRFFIRDPAGNRIEIGQRS